MKSASSFSRWAGYGAALAALLAVSSVQAAVGKAVVKAVRGTASYSEQGGEWKPLKTGKELTPGASVKTGVASQVDLFLDQNGPVVRVLEDSTLGIDKLDFDKTGADTVIETQLNLRQGTIQGVVNKLAAASKYEVRTPNTVAGIRGTEYEISANGVSHVIEGTVMIAYTNPITKKVSTHLVNQGQAFIPPTDPAAGTPTVRASREGEVHPRIQTPREAAPVAAVAPKAEPFVSPVVTQ